MRHLLLAVSLVGLIVATIAFINNRGIRTEIRDELAKFGLKTPEEHIRDGYDREELLNIAAKLDIKPPGRDARLLDMYRRPALLWNDVTFAIALGIFAAGLLLWVLVQFEPSGALRYLFIVMAASSLLYAVVDTAEDLVLDRILEEPGAISDSEARTASTLTRLKGVSIICSGAGGLVFRILDWKVPERQPPLF
jgi:hypothetical protein